MKYLILAILLCACGIVGAGEIYFVQIPFNVANSSGLFVVKSTTESWTLDEFISSGQLCAFRGRHEWADLDDYSMDTLMKWGICEDSVCSICHRCRQKIKVTKEIEEWEP